MEENKKRRLTMTSMIEAIDDIFVSTMDRPEEEELGYSVVQLTRLPSAGGDSSFTYQAKLMLDLPDAYEPVITTTSNVGFEEALAEMLKVAASKLEEHKKKILENLDSQLSRHKSAIRGARSRTRSKS